MALKRGETLQHFEIRDLLGAGAMGEVFCAHDSRLGRDVALEVLPEEAASDEECLVRFEREANALAAPSHANIARVHGIGQEGGTCFIEMELVPGEDPRQRPRDIGQARIALLLSPSPHDPRRVEGVRRDPRRLRGRPSVPRRPRRRPRRRLSPSALAEVGPHES